MEFQMPCGEHNGVPGRSVGHGCLMALFGAGLFWPGKTGQHPLFEMLEESSTMTFLTLRTWEITMPELEIIGAPQSTYVRTTRMALEEKGVPYTLTGARPHS